jgi:DNA polymerase-3 subunit alpha
LLAKNEQGYKKLVKLVSIAHLDGYYYKPRIDDEVLEKYADGLIGLSACVQGKIPRLLLSGGSMKPRLWQKNMKAGSAKVIFI